MRLMLAYDGSPGAEAARDLLSHLPLPVGSAITVVTALEKGPDLYGAPEFGAAPRNASEAEDLLLSDLQAMLHDASQALRTPDRQVDTRVVRGRPGSSLADEAHALQPDLIVVGSRGHGPVASMVLGSVSAELVDHAPCPVLVARGTAVRRLVVGADGSTSAERAIAALARWPLFAGLPAQAVTVAPPAVGWSAGLSRTFYSEWREADERQPDDRRERTAFIGQRAISALRTAGISATAEVREGDPADQLIAAANVFGADLIVVGSRGLSTLPRLVLGSVARKVLMHAPQSVLIVRELREKLPRAEPVPAIHGAGILIGSGAF
jgi:nucleotide-binding universal stress UspA family protein